MQRIGSHGNLRINPSRTVSGHHPDRPGSGEARQGGERDGVLQLEGAPGYLPLPVSGYHSTG